MTHAPVGRIWGLVLAVTLLAACDEPTPPQPDNGGPTPQNGVAAPPQGGLIVEGPEGVEVLLPVGADGGGGRIEVVEDAPPPPEGLEAVGPAYDIEVAGATPGRPAFVRLPLPDPSVADDPTRFVCVGHHDGTDWEILPAEIEGGSVLVRTGHFSRFRVMIGVQRDRPDAGEIAQLRIGTPSLWGVRVSGTLASAILDISACRQASSGRWFSRSVHVQRLRVYWSPPTGSNLLSRPRADAFVPYRRYDEDVYLEADRSRQSFFLNYDEASTMGVDGNDTVASYHNVQFRVAPVFADGTEGPNLSDAFNVYIGPAEAEIKLGMGLQARLGADDATAFREALNQNPYVIFFNAWALPADLYGQATGSVRRQLNSALWSGQLRSFIAMNEQSSYERVVTHEWGHYATNVIYGDEMFANFPGGNHSGWREADSRSLAMSEGLATFLGQWGTGRGVPPAAGAMMGRVRNLARDPAGENDAGTCWPNTRNLDATLVENIWATVLSRAARSYGFATVYRILRNSRPMDGLQFYRNWCASTLVSEEMACGLQQILLQEGIAWRVRGRVMGQPIDPEEEPIPLEGAEVFVQAVNEKEFVYDGQTIDIGGFPCPATSDEDGYFEMIVPPGRVVYVIEMDGWMTRPPIDRAADTSGATNAEAQDLEPFLMDPIAPPEVAITSPADDAEVTERVLNVTGTVHGTQNGQPDGLPIERARLFVNNDPYDISVANGTFSQQVLLSPGAVRIRLEADNDAGTSEDEVSITANIDATVLKVILTWAGSGTDVDLWVTDPEGVATGYTNRMPAEGRQLDIDDTDGYGPETYTMTRPIRGTYNIRINYYRGEGGESFRVRWVVHEGTPQERRGETSGGLSGADHNGSTPSANHHFTIEVP